jgi:hypothetical protein
VQTADVWQNRARLRSLWSLRNTESPQCFRSAAFFCFHHIQDLQCRGKRFDQLIPPPPLARSSSRQGRCLVSEPRTAEAGRSGQESPQSELIRDCAVDGTWNSGVSVDVAIRSRSSWEESREIAAAGDVFPLVVLRIREFIISTFRLKDCLSKVMGAVTAKLTVVYAGIVCVVGAPARFDQRCCEPVLSIQKRGSTSTRWLCWMP